jgi:hypothetical protein
MVHDRGMYHFPRVWDFDKIRKDEEGFVRSVTSAMRPDGTPYVDEKAARGLFKSLTNGDDFRQKGQLIGTDEFLTLVGTPASGREKARNEKLAYIPNHVFDQYILQNVMDVMPIYFNHFSRRVAYADEFGPVKYYNNGAFEIRHGGDEIATFMNGLPQEAIPSLQNAVQSITNPNYQWKQWSPAMRTAAAALQFGAAVAYMGLIVANSLPEFALQIAAGRNKLERDTARKVMWNTIKNIMTADGRKSNAMQRIHMEALGIVSAETVEFAMHGISDTREIMGMEGKLKSWMGNFYRATGITRYTSFQETLAGTTGLQVLQSATKGLLSEETNAYDKQQSIDTLTRSTGMNTREYAKLTKDEKAQIAAAQAAKVKLWMDASEAAGEPLSSWEAKKIGDPALIEAAEAVHEAVANAVRVRVAHATAGDVPFYYNDPVFKVVGQFKRFFYGATRNVLPNLAANWIDGEFKDAMAQTAWFAVIGTVAGYLGLLASQSKYLLMDTQPPFSIYADGKDAGDKLLTAASYGTTGVLASQPYLGMMDRPGGLIEPLNWAAGLGLTKQTLTDPTRLVDNLAIAGLIWKFGGMYQDKVDKQYLDRLSTNNSLTTANK